MAQRRRFRAVIKALAPDAAPARTMPGDAVGDAAGDAAGDATLAVAVSTAATTASTAAAASKPAKRGHMAAGITSGARKAKGRTLQQLVAQTLKDALGLRGNDVRSTSMGAAGDDIILSPYALRRAPYNFEMKWHEKLNIWSTIKQVETRHRKANAADSEEATLPAMVVKHNRAQPLAIIPFGHLCNLLRLELTEPVPNMPAREMCMLPMASTAQLLGDFDRGTMGWPAADLSYAIPLAVMFALRDPQAVSLARVDGRDQITCRSAGKILCITLHAAKTLNLWAEWRDPPDDERVPVLVFNRGNIDATIYAVLPLVHFIHLVKQRCRHVRQEELDRLQAEMRGQP